MLIAVNVRSFSLWVVGSLVFWVMWVAFSLWVLANGGGTWYYLAEKWVVLYAIPFALIDLVLLIAILLEK